MSNENPGPKPVLWGLISENHDIRIPIKQPVPLGSMNGIFTYIYDTNEPNVGNYNYIESCHTWILWSIYTVPGMS